MKIRNRFLLRTAGWLATRAIKLLFLTVRKQYAPGVVAMMPKNRTDGGRSIYAIWHENLLFPTVASGHPSIAVLISKHADGQLLNSLIQAMGMTPVLGSTNRGGIEAVRKLIDDDATWKHLAVTPDGPRGPRRVVQPGIIYVAAKTGMTIIPTAVAYSKPFRAKSWDRFAIPKPFRRAVLIAGDPIAIPETVKPDTLEPFRLIVQREMDRLHEECERWIETGIMPETGKPLESMRLAS